MIWKLAQLGAFLIGISIGLFISYLVVQSLLSLPLWVLFATAFLIGVAIGFFIIRGKVIYE